MSKSRSGAFDPVLVPFDRHRNERGVLHTFAYISVAPNELLALHTGWSRDSSTCLPWLAVCRRKIF